MYIICMMYCIKHHFWIFSLLYFLSFINTSEKLIKIVQFKPKSCWKSSFDTVKLSHVYAWQTYSTDTNIWMTLKLDLKYEQAPGGCTWYIVSIWLTSVLSYLSIPHPWWSLSLDKVPLNFYLWHVSQCSLCLTHNLIKANICTNYLSIPLPHWEVTVWTNKAGLNLDFWPLRTILTFWIAVRLLHATHHLIKANTSAKLFGNPTIHSEVSTQTDMLNNWQTDGQCDSCIDPTSSR